MDDNLSIKMAGIQKENSSESYFDGEHFEGHGDKWDAIFGSSKKYDEDIMRKCINSGDVVFKQEVDNKKYADVFAKAHTLISVGTKMQDFQWQMTDPYMSLIWEAKKNIAARGIKYLNWIAVLNQLQNSDEIPLAELHGAAKRFGFRAAEPLHERSAFRYIENGYCAADMAKFPQLFKMSMQDVYARREILTLTDFLWKK
jgi:hypothetical protein